MKLPSLEDLSRNGDQWQQIKSEKLDIWLHSAFLDVRVKNEKTGSLVRHYTTIRAKHSGMQTITMTFNASSSSNVVHHQEIAEIPVA